ncbi:MAG: MATE family efflux transporter [Nannocystaceae bacterium]
MSAEDPRELSRRFIALAWPNVAASLLVPVLGLVDTAMLGHLPEIRHLAGVGLASVLFDYVYWTFGFLRMSTTGLTAQAMGRGSGLDVRLVGARGMGVALVTGVILVLLHRPLADLCFGLLEGTQPLKASGRAYFDARIFGAPAALANFVLVGWLLGIQSSRRVLLMSLVGNGANIVLDYVFIYRLGWASAGAGYATMVSQYLMLAAGLALAWPRWRGQARLRWRDVVAAVPLREFTRLSGDITVRTLALISAFAIFTNFSAALSVMTLATNVILLKILSLASYFIDGFAFATESLAGLWFGSNQRTRLRPLLVLALRFGVVTALLFAGAFAAFPGPLFGALTNHPEVGLSLAAQRWWLLPLLGVGSVAYVLDGYFLGLAAGRIMSRSMLVSFGFGFLPLALWGRYVVEDARLLWVALCMFMVVRVVTLAVRVPATLRDE